MNTRDELAAVVVPVMAEVHEPVRIGGAALDEGDGEAELLLLIVGPLKARAALHTATLIALSEEPGRSRPWRSLLRWRRAVPPLSEPQPVSSKVVHRCFSRPAAGRVWRCSVRRKQISESLGVALQTGGCSLLKYLFA